MIGLIPAVLLAAALVVAPAEPSQRIGTPRQATSNAPRDGPRAADPERCASDIELFAACVGSGLPPAAAAAAVADTHVDGPSPWQTVASLSALGVEPARAWSELHRLPGGEDLAGLVTMSAASGAAVVDGCERIAAHLRDEAGDRAKAKAERAGVLIAIPLTACFLPAFFVLGLAPAVISLGATLIN